jgi:hypothetical protein
VKPKAGDVFVQVTNTFHTPGCEEHSFFLKVRLQQ